VAQVLSEAIEILKTWSWLDNGIVVTAALAAMACAVPGVFLVVRRQSMMGDAISHAVLPGIVLALLVTHQFRSSGWLSTEAYHASTHVVLFVGALILGVLAAVLTETIQKWGHVEASAALGVVFTSLFALGLLLVRLAADQVHVDPDCVLYGDIETVVMDTFGSTGVPRAAVVNGIVLLLNLLLLTLFFKELRISAFDPALSNSMGIRASAMHYGLMAITAATLVAAFESVGSILVIAMLVLPASTAHLLTDRLRAMVVVSLVVAAASAVLGHVLAITVPAVTFRRLGIQGVADASTAGMMAVAGGFLLLMAVLFGPRYGVVSRAVDRLRIGVNMAAEDILGALYRFEEDERRGRRQPQGVSPWLRALARIRLAWRGDIVSSQGTYQLTDSGRIRAESLVRSHRLWESYMARHFELPNDHLHAAAELAEHFIDPPLREELASELRRPEADPHGTSIPDEPRGDQEAGSAS
jgi:manganese/zinc/iron transport system permease protein